jgi:aminopeptidase N
MALEKASGRELESWAQEWLQTAGVNTLAPEFDLAEDGTYASFSIRQTAAADYPTQRRHRLGVGLYDKVDGRLVRRTSFETDVEGELSEVKELVGQKQPDLLLLNDGDLAYAKIRLDERSLDTLVTSIETIDDSLARALCWGAVWDMTRDAEMTATDFVTLVLSGIASETDAFGVNRIPGYAATAANQYSAPEHRQALRARWETGLRELLMTAEQGGDHQLSFARAYASAAHSEQALADLEGLLDGSLEIDGLVVDTDLRWTLLAGLAKNGKADGARIDEELTRDNTISGKEHAAAARTLMPTAEAKAEAWELAMVRDDVPNETQRSIVLAFQVYGQDDVLAPYVEKYLEAAETMWEEKGTQRASTALEYIFPKQLASQELLDRVDQWLETSQANPAAKRYVREGRDDVARALRAQARDRSA